MVGEFAVDIVHLSTEPGSVYRDRGDTSGILHAGDDIEHFLRASQGERGNQDATATVEDLDDILGKAIHLAEIFNLVRLITGAMRGLDDEGVNRVGVGRWRISSH